MKRILVIAEKSRAYGRALSEGIVHLAQGQEGALLEALSGVRYDAADKALRLRPGATAASRSFLCTGTGFGTVVVADGVLSVTGTVGRIDARQR